MPDRLGRRPKRADDDRRRRNHRWGQDYGNEYEFGLDLILNGSKTWLAA
jgi:hypothetical protein